MHQCLGQQFPNLAAHSPGNAHIDYIRMSVRVGVLRYFRWATKFGNHRPRPTPIKPN